MIPKHFFLNIILILFISILVGCSPSKKVVYNTNQNQILVVKGKDDTDAIQKAITSLDKSGGGILNIPSQAKFRLKKLKLGDKVSLCYSESSDLDADSGHTKNSGEIVNFLSGSNKNGIVNEYVIAGSYHPGLILDVRKDVNGQNRFLGRDQKMSDPSRASFIFRDEGMNQVVMQYKNYKKDSPFAGWNINAHRNLYEIKGIGQKDFKKIIQIGDLVTNYKKTALGIIDKVEENNLSILWTSGRFKSNEKIIIEGQESSRKSSEATYRLEYTNSIGLNRTNGYTSIGLPNGNAIHPLSVGGRIGIQSSRSFGQYLPENIKLPSIAFADSFENETERGFQISASIYKGKKYRAVLTDKDGKKIKANLGAVGVHTSFDDRRIPSSSSFNVKSVINMGLGKYKIIFETPFDLPDYQVGLSTSHPLDFAYVGKKEKTYLIINVVQTGTEKPRTLNSNVSVICTGGDG